MCGGQQEKIKGPLSLVRFSAGVVYLGTSPGARATYVPIFLCACKPNRSALVVIWPPAICSCATVSLSVFCFFLRFYVDHVCIYFLFFSSVLCVLEYRCWLSPRAACGREGRRSSVAWSMSSGGLTVPSTSPGLAMDGRRSGRPFVFLCFANKDGKKMLI